MVDDLGGVGETATLDGGSTARRAGGAYLLVVEDGKSWRFPLPDPGLVTIGRTPEVELRLEHSSVSRRHARIIVDRGELRVSDLDSHNGTRVNGELLTGGRALTTGDVVAVGEVILVVHAELQRELPHVILDDSSWRRRLAEEVERAVAFQRSLAVLAIAGAPAEIGNALRTIDVVGRAHDGLVMALLPEADPRTALELAQLVSRAVKTAAPDARVGVATCPSDATDADNLVLAASAAARVARPGEVAEAGDAVERRTLGEREVVVCHPAMVRVFDLLKRLAASDLPVLIIGETGVGKENAAYAVHHHSARHDKPFIALNCAAMPEHLVESQLFGHDKGAFTGATTVRPGVFESASGGTLFLDELAELPLPVQAKLLRVLEAKRITRVGETREREVDVRIVAATNRVLEQEVEAGRFRLDLYHRIGAAHVYLPPLRERRCEIPILFREFVAQAARRKGREPPVPSPQVMQCLLAHRWPGNVRELKYLADRLIATIEDDRIELDDLQPELSATLAALEARLRPPRVELKAAAPMRRLADELEEIERQRMAEALTNTGGVKTRAAAMLGMPIRTFNMKVKQYGL
jgi:DNA-binding NtrC family response regulator